MVGQAERVRQAIVAMCDLRPALVVLDIQMPDGDGVAVLRAARRFAPAAAARVLTDRGGVYDCLRCEAAGADGFLDKSQPFEEILRILRGLTEQGVANHG